MLFSSVRVVMWVAAMWCVLGVQAAHAQPTVVQAPSRSLVLSAVVPSFTIPLHGAVDPDAIWQTTPAALDLCAIESNGRWEVNATQLTAAKFILTATSHDIYTLEVPLDRMDEVQLFWRSPAGAWKSAKAGDTVALQY